ncbi:Shedu anti-phage system protein SduA domain-containing protein [Chryseobacterium kwangjuense]|uniref:Shedu anti-phage system protein SduA domain-containing protein n=1 Tax=Chryseobacterium kwangjuense TaxID=267125 RepID=A0ABW9K5Z9_9FLAO
MNLQEKAEYIENNGSFDDINDFILELYSKNDTEALDIIIQLATSNYGGEVYKSELQYTALAAILHWGIIGIQKLGLVAMNSPFFSVKKNTIVFLGHISSRSLNQSILIQSRLDCVKFVNIFDEKHKNIDLILESRNVMVEIVTAHQGDIFPIEFITALQLHYCPTAQEHIFIALISRWFKFNGSGLIQYHELINSSNTDNNELTFHNFIKENPFLLEPFHAKIWSKPRFGEALVPDFLIRSMDNSYTVVEIEQPGFSIMTRAGELSAQTTHAKRQALDFRSWAIDNRLYADQQYKGIYRPYCLVVIGKESDLNEMQIQRLRQENESTQGVLKIVGFDWLYNRAKTTLENMLVSGFEKND